MEARQLTTRVLVSRQVYRFGPAIIVAATLALAMATGRAQVGPEALWLLASVTVLLGVWYVVTDP